MCEETICCPECGEELGFRDEVYLYVGGDTVVGCSLCIGRFNAAEWYSEVQFRLEESCCYEDYCAD